VRSVDGQLITLSHHSAPLVRRLSDPANAELLAAALRATLGGEWQLRWEQGGAEPTAEPSLPPPQAEAAPTGAAPDPAGEAEPEPQPATAADEKPGAGGSPQGTEDAAITLLAQHLGASKIDG
jgi:DNA polymerase-3 subunit gamma/tau